MTVQAFVLDTSVTLGALFADEQDAYSLAVLATLLVPPLADRAEALLSPLIRLGPKTTGDGFLSGLLVGAALSLAAGSI